MAGAEGAAIGCIARAIAPATCTPRMRCICLQWRLRKHIEKEDERRKMLAAKSRALEASGTGSSSGSVGAAAGATAGSGAPAAAATGGSGLR